MDTLAKANVVPCLSELCWIKLDDCGQQVLPVVNKKCLGKCVIGGLVVHMPPTFECGHIADGLTMSQRFRRGVAATPKRKLEELEEQLGIKKPVANFDIGPGELPVEEFLLAMEEMLGESDEEEDWNAPLPIEANFVLWHPDGMPVPADFVPSRTYTLNFEAVLRGDLEEYAEEGLLNDSHKLLCYLCNAHAGLGMGTTVDVFQATYRVQADAEGRMVIPQNRRPAYVIAHSWMLRHQSAEAIYWQVLERRQAIELLWEFHCDECNQCLITFE